MRLGFVLFFLTLIVAPLLAGEKAAEPVAIAAVNTWGDLSRQPAVALHKNATAKFGIQTVRAPRGSGVMIYCMTEAYDPDDDSNAGGGERLGPYRLFIRKPSDDPEPPEKPDVPQNQDPGKRDYGRLVYGQVLFMDAVGTHVVELRDGNDTVVAAVKVECVEGSFQAWTSLVAVDDAPEPLGEEVENAVPSEMRTTPGLIGVPKVSGDIPILFWMASGTRGPKRFEEDDPLPRVPGLPEGEGKAVVPLTAEEKSAAEKWVAELANREFVVRSDASVALLALGPAANEVLRAAAKKTADAETLLRLRKVIAAHNGPLHIELDGQNLVLKAVPPYDLTGVANKLLARWWVNGRPVKPKAEPDGEMETVPPQVAVDSSKNAHVKVRMDSAALGAKSGDTIALQVMLAPDGTQLSAADAPDEELNEKAREGDESDEEGFPPHVPILSNRIEFKVP